MGKLLDVNTEFEKFFNESVQFIVDMFKKPTTDMVVPDQALFLVKAGRIEILPITVFPDSVVISGQRQEFPPGISNLPASVVARGIIEDSHPDAYVIAAQGWVRKNPDTNFRESMKDSERPPGTIAHLPADQRIELLSFIGRTMDGKQNYSRYFEMKRENHGNDTSRLVDLIEMTGWRVTNAEDLYPMK